jgi:lipid-binding SYLF domain-containing protein
MIVKFIGAALLSAVALLSSVSGGQAASAGEIDRTVDATLERFYASVGGARDLAARARGVLVFPQVIKAGIGVGGEYGEGALRVSGQTAGYYNTVSGSVGFQLGVETRSILILFMTDTALTNFRKVNGWNIGVDASVAVITLGAGASIDVNNVTDPVVGFVLDPKGLMYNLTLEGSKITRLEK